jgi:putative phosphoesterase
MTRLAVLSDIHGNLWALKAVLEDAQSEGVDALVNLGDVLSGPLDPSGTADLLMSIELPTVAGNHERQLLACEAAKGGPSDQFAFEHTTELQRDWLRGLPRTMVVPGGVFLCHGTPTSDTTSFLEDVSAERLALTRLDVIEARAGAIPQPLLLCGHSHVPRMQALSGGRLVVNPGSVGLQAYTADFPSPHVVECGSPHARYAVCERTPRGWSVSLRCVEYDAAPAAALARRNGREDWGRWLETGRV